MFNFLGIDIQEKRKKLLASHFARRYIDEIISHADRVMTGGSLSFKMSEYMMYCENGNRSAFEKGYFSRRKNASALMMALWFTEDPKYLLPLVDYIGYICDEFTWCLPAHSKFPHVSAEEATEKVDLFQAETARLFAETALCVGDILPEYILDRMQHEVRRRIFASFAKGVSYWWERTEMNWTTVCGAGCVIAAFCFGTEAEKTAYVERFTPCLDAYLRGIKDDGCCQEGPSYWTYGFGNFVLLAQVIKVYTKGNLDYFQNPKVKELALYPQRTRLSDSKIASFSDGTDKFSFRIGLLSFLKSVYNEVSLPDLKYGTWKSNIDSVIELLWFDESYSADPHPCTTNFFADTQWYIKQMDSFSFAAKGGNNEEPHNHNDIGSFMVSVGDDVLICDLGCGEYTKQTLETQTRYTYIQNGSQGHSVPIINGQYQQFGERYRAYNVEAGPDYFTLDMEDAYPEGIIDSLHRRFDISSDTITLTDCFIFSPLTSTVTERFVSKIKPALSEGVLDLGIGKIHFDPTRYYATVSTDVFVTHRTADRVPVYLMDISPKHAGETVFQIKITTK